jgi:polyisoprenoid-binding protein YceI
MRHIVLFLAALLPLAAHAADWKVDPAHSTLGFSGDYQGDAFHGRFKQFDAAIRFDPADLGHARFDVTVKLGSVDTSNPERDQTLTGSDFFAIDRFPTAHFVTTAFHRDPAGQVSADGTLQLHGVRQPVTLTVDFKSKGDDATLDVDTTLDRKAYKLGTAADWDGIGKHIAVHAHLLLHRSP